jgi:catechol 2,3-dioxygenase-like lactoylglutathione lyase family enzyme
MPARRVVIDHLTVGVRDLEQSRRFYRAALAPLGFHEFGAWREGVRELTFGVEGADDFAISLEYPVGPGVHIAFAAERREQVDAFYAAAIAAGGRDNGAPGIRPHYHANYYGAFVLDPDGHNVEAVCHKPG